MNARNLRMISENSLRGSHLDPIALDREREGAEPQHSDTPSLHPAELSRVLKLPPRLDALGRMELGVICSVGDEVPFQGAQKPSSLPTDLVKNGDQ